MFQLLPIIKTINAITAGNIIKENCHASGHERFPLLFTADRTGVRNLRQRQRMRGEGVGMAVIHIEISP